MNKILKNNPKMIFRELVVTTLSFLIVFSVVEAGSLTPSALPTAQSYTFSDIMARLVSNTSATAGNHSLNATTTPQATFPNLTSIYNAIPTIYAGDFLASSTYFGVTGTVAVKTGNTAVASSSAQSTSLVFTVPTGYYSGTDTVTVSTTSSAFISGNIANGVNLFGIIGTAPAINYSLWNLQTIDDWVCSGATSCTGKTEYTAEEGTWSNVSGSPFDAGFATSSTPLNYFPVGANVYLASGMVKKDDRTGLWWSDVASTGSVTAVATSTTNSFTLTGSVGVGDGTRPWDTATTTATNGNAINFCNALNAISFAGYTDWYLPTQKQLMQAYINGSANNIPNPGNYFWSSTETYNNTAYAWYVLLPYGYTNNNTKTSSNYVRCVR